MLGSRMVERSAAISRELASFLESGISILVGSRDAQKRPATMRAMGAIVGADRHTIAVFVPEPNAARTLANLADNGRIAVTFSRPSDYRSFQLKGRCLTVRPATTDELERQKLYLDAFVDDLALVGMGRQTTERLTYMPSIAVEIAVEALFEQTPGPAAGRKLEAGGS